MDSKEIINIVLTSLSAEPQTNQTNVTIPCDLRIFEMSYLSTKPNMTVADFTTSCPDTIFVPIVAWIEIAIFIPLFIITFFGIIWKRKSGHIQARNLSCLIPMLIASFFSVMFPTLRWALGRDIFPCGVLMFILYHMPWAMVLPPLLNILTFIVRHALYKLLTGNFKDLSDQVLGVDRNSLKIGENKDLANTYEEMQQAVESVLAKSPSVTSISTISNLQETEGKSMAEQTKSTDLVSTIGALDFTKNEVRLFKFYRFLLSAKFRILCYSLCFLFHVSLWLIMGLVQLTNSVAVADYYNTGITNFMSGCIMHPKNILMLCIMFGTYLVVTVILLLISFFLEKDTWGIKIETSVASVLLLIAVINYLVCPYITIIRTYTDYIFPYGQSMVIYSILQPIIFVTIPLCRAIYSDNNAFSREGETTMFEKILLNKETFKIALDFSRRSYCSEPVLCFDNIENYMKARKRSNKLKIARHILTTYLTKGAPLELNIDRIEERFVSLQDYITKQDEKKIDEEMDLLRIHCLQDVSEMMYRLILSNKEVKEIVMGNAKTRIEPITSDPPTVKTSKSWFN